MDHYFELDSPTWKRRIAQDERKAKWFAEKMKTSKFYIELKATQLERRDEFSKQVFVEKITNSEYGRFIKLGGEYPKTIEVQTSDIEIEYIPTRKNLYVKLSEPNLKIINDFVTC
jgi:hypothetical protein